MRLMEGLKLREARISDLDKLVELGFSVQRHVETSNPNIWRITDNGKTGFKLELERMLADREGQVLVAVKDNDPVGFVYGRVSRREDYLPRCVGYISIIYVWEGFRRKGVGSNLIGELCKFFSSKNVEDVTLRYVLGNVKAERFWMKLGFKPLIHTANTSLEKLEKSLVRT